MSGIGISSGRTIEWKLEFNEVIVGRQKGEYYVCEIRFAEHWPALFVGKKSASQSILQGLTLKWVTSTHRRSVIW